MKSTKYIYKVLMVFLLAHFPLYAQYTGGSADGNSSNEFINSVCGNPAHFYAYFGGNGEGESVNTLINATCTTPPGGFAYLGGIGDGDGIHTFENTTCGLPPGAYAYTGGTGDGEGLDVLMSQSCPFPPQFYAFFGGNGDGHSMAKSTSCAVVLPIADFSASPTTVCVNGNVTFTDLSTNAVGWEWTIPGATFVTPSTIYSQNPVVKFATAGTYTVTLKARNNDGDDIETKTSYITVGAAATITSTTSGARCGAGSVTIGATSGGVVRWYDTATGGTLLGTGSNFTTPSISSTTTYYAEAFNGCISSTRTAVVATVNTIPTITGNPAARCDAGTVTISANPSVGTVTWFDVPSGGTALSTGSVFTTPSISTTTTYYAETTSAEGCVSTRISVVATVNTAPTITSTTPNSRCGAGVVNLSATASSGIINWYTVPVGGTPIATGNNFNPNLSATTTYYVDATVGGCTSSRTAVTATINATPTITSTTPASRCDAGSVTLQASASSGTLNWYNTPTGGTSLGTGTSFTTPSISISTNFYVESTNGTCTSTRTAVLASVNLTPSITSTFPSQVCDSGSVTLGAIANSGTINWYNVASGGSVLGTGTSFTTPSISTTTTFYAEAVNSGCNSVRVPIVATVNSTPSITSTTDLTICGNVGGTLSATTSAGTVYWYTVVSGGTAFATGTSIPVSGGSYTFYAEAVSNGCTSARVPVVYTSTPYPVITSVSSASRCGNGSLTLLASSDFGVVNWYDSPTGGNLLATGTSFITPPLTNTTSYYVEAVNNNCVSTSRVEIVATINHTPPPSANANQTFCLGETVGLINVVGSNVVWYDSSIGGNVIPYGTAIVSGTTYYASQTISGCESEERTPVVMITGGCLGIDDLIKFDIKLYPNPVEDILTIKSTDFLSRVEVANMLGQLIFVQQIDNLETTIDMARYPTGTYSFRVYINDKVEVFKVLKK